MVAGRHLVTIAAGGACLALVALNYWIARVLPYDSRPQTEEACVAGGTPPHCQYWTRDGRCAKGELEANGKCRGHDDGYRMLLTMPALLVACVVFLVALSR
jgi:hypothetical protein